MGKQFEKNREVFMKICFAASSGGHFEQLMMLKPLMEKYESFVVTEKTGYEVKTMLLSAAGEPETVEMPFLSVEKYRGFVAAVA